MLWAVAKWRSAVADEASRGQHHESTTCDAQEQDAWRVAAGGKLCIAYGTYQRAGSSAMAVAELVYATARSCGLAIK